MTTHSPSEVKQFFKSKHPYEPPGSWVQIIFLLAAVLVILIDILSKTR